MKKLFITFILFTQIITAQKRPNILFFLVDDMGVQDTSVPFYYKNGKPVVQKPNTLFRTPNMEKLAKNGVKFTNAYAYSVCSPTRVSLLTGQDALQHGVTTWTHPSSTRVDTGKFDNGKITSASFETVGIPKNRILLTDELHKLGYTNLFAGKAHFGPNDTENGNPLNLGFDVNIAGHGGGGPGGYYGKNGYGARSKVWGVPGLKKYHGTDTFLTEALTLEMNQAIENSVKKKETFFSYMSHYAVHSPFHLDPRFEQNYPNLKGHNKAYATLVEGMDKSLGDMIQKLNELGVAEETLVIFYSDNGSARMMANGFPYRGMKGHRHEGELRVPLIVAWAKPNAENPIQKAFPIAKNSVNEKPITCNDIFPTLIGIAQQGKKSIKHKSLDGFDKSHYITNAKGKRYDLEFMVHFPHGQHNNNMFTSYVYQDWKIIYNYINGKWELYHLASDIKEAHNLIGEKKHHKKAKKMAKRMLKQLKKKKARFPKDKKTGLELIPDLNTI